MTLGLWLHPVRRSAEWTLKRLLTLSFQDEIKREMIEITDRLTSERRSISAFEVSKRQVCILAGEQPVRTIKRQTDDGDTNERPYTTALYDEINGDELKLKVRKLRRLMQLSVPESSASDQSSKFKELDLIAAVR